MLLIRKQREKFGSIQAVYKKISLFKKTSEALDGQYHVIIEECINRQTTVTSQEQYLTITIILPRPRETLTCNEILKT